SPHFCPANIFQRTCCCNKTESKHCHVYASAKCRKLDHVNAATLIFQDLLLSVVRLGINDMCTTAILFPDACINWLLPLYSQCRIRCILSEVAQHSVSNLLGAACTSSILFRLVFLADISNGCLLAGLSIRVVELNCSCEFKTFLQSDCEAMSNSSSTSGESNNSQATSCSVVLTKFNRLPSRNCEQTFSNILQFKDQTVDQSRAYSSPPVLRITTGILGLPFPSSHADGSNEHDSVKLQAGNLPI
ncbi:hypothetical protein TTRE_0000871501, partial [Trichuris trichiura]